MNGKVIDGREIAVKVAIDSPGKEDDDAKSEGNSSAPTGAENSALATESKTVAAALKHGQSHALQLWASHQYDGPKRSSSMVYIILGLSTQYTTHFNFAKTLDMYKSIQHCQSDEDRSDVGSRWFQAYLAGYWWISRAVEPSFVKI